MIQQQTGQTPVSGCYGIVYDTEGRTVIRNVTLEIFPGTITGIVGDNGAGKSLLLAISAGVCRPLLGDVVFAKKHIEEAPRGAIGYLPETPWLDQRLMVWQWLEYKASLTGIPLERLTTTEPLERLGIADCSSALIVDLSPAQQRLVSLAALLILEASVLILDSPLDLLSDAASDRASTCLRREAERGAGILISSCSKLRLSNLTHRLIAMQNGRLEKTE